MLAHTPAQPIGSGAGFDYNQLEPAVAETARTSARQIQSEFQAQQNAIFAIGEELRRAKEAIGHRQFGAWIAAEFGMTERTAERYMRVAVVFAGKSDTVSVLQPSTLYLISARSTPADVVEHVVERLTAGERLPDDEIKAQIVEAKDKAKRAAALAKLRPRQRKSRARKEADGARERELHERERALGRTAGEAAATLVLEALGSRLDEFLKLYQRSLYHFNDAMRQP